MDVLMVLYASIMGLVEGITEFLPISSTGHLIIMGDVLNFHGPKGKVFEISIQLGAILSVCWLYRNKLFHTAACVLRERESQRFAFNIALAFLPAAALGALFHHFITEHLFSVRVVATTMFLGGFVILAIEKWKPAPTVRALDDITPLKALLIGFCQSLAMIPGVSRSGATIMGALLLGVERKAATEFSFFLAIPTMFAATIYDVYKNRADLTTDGMTLLAIGFVVAFLSALVVVQWLIGFLSRRGFGIFAWYRIVAGGILLVVLGI